MINGKESDAADIAYLIWLKKGIDFYVYSYNVVYLHRNVALLSKLPDSGVKITNAISATSDYVDISRAQNNKDVTPFLTPWSYIFVVLSPRYIVMQTGNTCKSWKYIESKYNIAHSTMYSLYKKISTNLLLHLVFANRKW